MDIKKKANVLFGPSPDERDQYRVSVILVAPSGKCLALQREPGKKTGGGTWGGPGGHIDPLETFAVAALRETLEETGIKATNPRYLGCQEVDGKKYAVFAAATDAEHKPKLDHEHTAYKWVEPKSWPNKVFPGFANLLKSEQALSVIKSLAPQAQQPASQAPAPAVMACY